MEYDHLILSSISNHNKERPLPLSYPILNENPDPVIHFLPMHGEKLSLRPDLSQLQQAARRKHVGTPSAVPGAAGRPQRMPDRRLVQLRRW